MDELKWVRNRIKINFNALKRFVKNRTSSLGNNLTAPFVSIFLSSSSISTISPVLSLNKPFDFKSLHSLSYQEVIFRMIDTLFPRKFFSIDFALASRDRDFERFRFLGMSKKPVLVSTSFSSPKALPSFSEFSYPSGIKAVLKSIEEHEEPKIPSYVYDFYEEKIKAREALRELYLKGEDVYYLSTLLSVGVLGEIKNPIPTRFAITAVDSELARFNISFLEGKEQISSPMAFFYEAFFNEFFIFMFPGAFEFENFEFWGNKLIYDYQFGKNKKSYSPQAGAYYATLFSVSEFLRKIGKTAKVMVIRIISKDYNIPLGVWQVRESIRKAFNNPKPREELEELLKKKGLLRRIKQRSVVLNQNSILEFF